MRSIRKEPDAGRRGKAIEHLIAASCIIATRGKLKVSTSLVDDEGMDLVFTAETAQRRLPFRSSSTTSWRLLIGQTPMRRPLSGQSAPQARELVLVDAKHVLDLSGGKGPKLRWQLGQLDRDASVGKAESLGAVARTSMEIDLRRLKAKTRADPQGGVVNRQLPNPRNRSDHGLDQLEQLIKGRSLPQRRDVVEQTAPTLLESGRGHSVLVRMALAAWQLSESCLRDCVILCWQDAEVVQLALRGAAVMFRVVGSDGP
jgi:hypothetical protein